MTEFRRAQLTVYADNTPKVEHEFRGDPSMIPLLIGAMEMTKNEIIRYARLPQSGFVSSENVAQADGASHSTEQKVKKAEALKAYRYALCVLQGRISEIDKMPADQTFLIDPDILSKL